MPVAGAVIGAVAGIGGAVLSANSQKKAANKAAGAQKDASDANIALAKDTYNQNAQRLDPTVTGGQQAGGILQGLLYGGTAPVSANSGAVTLPAHETAEPVPPELTGGPFGLGAIGHSIIQKIQNGETVSPETLQHFGLSDYATKYAAWKNGGTTAMSGQPMTSAAALSAFDTFRNSTDYKWRYDQGLKAVQQGMGALGAFDSGATRKAEIEYGQHFASTEIGNYMDRLAQQQGFGLGAASALAGVSQNMATASMNANNATASAAGNAALAKGAANQNMWGQIASAGGVLASSFLPKG